MALEQKNESEEALRTVEMEQLVKEMAAHFRIKDEGEQQAHYRSWRHALQAHVNRYRSYYYSEG